MNVEVADTEATRIKGLQGRTSLPADQGMLFVFPREDMYNFWMKETLIPLDMIWINDAGTVVDIKTDLPPCKDNPCTMYVPKARARFVLELNGGAAGRMGLQPGDQASFK